MIQHPGDQPGEQLTATAIDNLGNTSEFARNVAAVQGSAPETPTPTLPQHLAPRSLRQPKQQCRAQTPTMPTTPIAVEATGRNHHVYLPRLQH